MVRCGADGAGRPAHVRDFNKRDRAASGTRSRRCPSQSRRDWPGLPLGGVTTSCSTERGRRRQYVDKPITGCFLGSVRGVLRTEGRLSPHLAKPAFQREALVAASKVVNSTE